MWRQKFYLYETGHEGDPLQSQHPAPSLGGDSLSASQHLLTFAPSKDSYSLSLALLPSSLPLLNIYICWSIPRIKSLPSIFSLLLLCLVSPTKKRLSLVEPISLPPSPQMLPRTQQTKAPPPFVLRSSCWPIGSFGQRKASYWLRKVAPFQSHHPPSLPSLLCPPGFTSHPCTKTDTLKQTSSSFNFYWFFRVNVETVTHTSSALLVLHNLCFKPRSEVIKFGN